MYNRCVCCGEIIPEGRQVCPAHDYSDDDDEEENRKEEDTKMKMDKNCKAVITALKQYAVDRDMFDVQMARLEKLWAQIGNTVDRLQSLDATHISTCVGLWHSAIHPLQHDLVIMLDRMLEIESALLTLSKVEYTIIDAWYLSDAQSKMGLCGKMNYSYKHVRRIANVALCKLAKQIVND